MMLLFRSQLSAVEAEIRAKNAEIASHRAAQEAAPKPRFRNFTTTRKSCKTSTKTLSPKNERIEPRGTT